MSSAWYTAMVRIRSTHVLHVPTTTWLGKGCGRWCRVDPGNRAAGCKNCVWNFSVCKMLFVIRLRVERRRPRDVGVHGSLQTLRLLSRVACRLHRRLSRLVLPVGIIIRLPLTNPCLAARRPDGTKSLVTGRAAPRRTGAGLAKFDPARGRAGARASAT
eukprot:272854-Chlamydomonas_euryale.AAC.9